MTDTPQTLIENRRFRECGIEECSRVVGVYDLPERSLDIGVSVRRERQPSPVSVRTSRAQTCR